MQNGAVSLLTNSFVATALVAANRFIGADGQHADAGGNAIGVGRTDGEPGERVPLDVLGTTLVEAGGVVDAWAVVQVGADGKAVAKTAEGVAVGRVQGAGGTDGTLLEVLLFPN